MNKKIFLLVMTFSLVAQATSGIFSKIKNDANLKSCPLINNSEERSVELTKSWESLPAKLLVAKRAHLIVDSKDFHAESLQDFLNLNSKVKECLVVSNKNEKDIVIKAKKRFSVLAPTVIDLSSEKKTGSTVWNFQLFYDQKNINTWNSISHASTSSFDLSKVFKEQGFQEKYFRLRGNEYEVVATKEVDGHTVMISIVFEH